MNSKPATAVSPVQLATVFNAAFTNYIGNEVNFTENSVVTWCADNYVSLELSHIFFPSPDSTEPVAFGLIAIRDDKPKESRLAGMGVVPTYRGKGTGYQVLEMIISAERKRGICVLELECIRQNEPALRLYKRVGFSVLRELVGWEKDMTSVTETRLVAGLTTCTIEELDKLVKMHGATDLSWQAWGFSRLPGTERVFKLGHAYCAISNPDNVEDDKIKMTSLFVEPEWRGKGEARRLAEAMIAKYPGKIWVSVSNEIEFGLTSLERRMGRVPEEEL
ncbi:hypothetical protein G7Z17_g3681 [Cylindrodendrum hubeiense]|uniref:N-acetyltransferase domain-containing protein n=1 Tax=Cylindrodendrum hubeiense TaxID=595255 RepID=A0A9P5HFF0_9HYPO|nr:hypothetical protein G7Z17_g3681 [Cylindrodendrum hubeiense]